MDKIIEQNVALAKEKNSQAMSFLYEHFYKDVYYTCLKFLNNEELAKDMTHDTFIKAFEKLDDLSDDTKFKSWICQIANRLSLNYIKRSNIITFEEMPESEELLSSSYEGDKTPEDITVDNEVATTLLQAIAKLPNDQRICVFMFYYENMSVKEIASQIECTENTVRGKLRYASNNLQKYIENLGDNGLKLRCIGILPFLYAIFNVERASITATPSAQALASIAQISGNVVNSAAVNSAVANSAVSNSAVNSAVVNSAVVNSAVVTTAATAAKASILPFVLIGSGIAATITAAVVAAVVIVGDKDTGDKDMSFTSKATISQESSDIVENNSDDNTIDSTDETTDSATDDSTEVVDTGNSETDFVHYNIDNVFEPIMWGKYLFYYDITAEKSIIMDMETGITVKEMDKKTTLYRDCDDAVIILWNRDEYKDICIIGKNNDYIYEDTMYIGDENHDYAFFTRDYAINDLMTTKNNNYVYISYKDNSYSIKSVNLLDGTVTYENAVSQGVIAAKNEYYAVYSNKTTDECSILNIETGEPIATYPKSEVSLIQIILLGEHFAIWQSESGYLVDYTRYNLQGIADVEMHFSKDDKISFAQGGIERAQGMDCLSLEKREENDGGITERGLYRSDMTPILELSSEYVYYTPYETNTIYSDVFPTYDYLNNHIGYVYTDGFNNCIEASQMVDMMESYGFIEVLNNAPTKKIINIENGAIFEVSSTAEVQRIKCTGTDSYNFIVMEDDKTDIYDELGNYIFTTTVPIYYSLNDTQKMWRTKDNKFYVYNNTNEKESNIYVYNTSTATETTIATEKPVVYAFMADESNIIYSTKSKSGNYTYIMKNIETAEETELFVCKCGVLYSCNEYGFVIGKTNTDINYISDIPCDVIMYNNN